MVSTFRSLPFTALSKIFRSGEQNLVIQIFWQPPAQKLKRKLFCCQLLRLSDEVILRKISRWLFTERREMVGPCWSCCCKILQRQDKNGKKIVEPGLVFCHVYCFLMSLFAQTQHYHRSLATKVKSGCKKASLFLGLVLQNDRSCWTAVDIKVSYRHTRNLYFDTLFQDEDDDGRPCIFRVVDLVQTRVAGDDNYNYVSYVPHFRYPDSTPPESEWLFSRHSEVKEGRVTQHKPRRPCSASRAPAPTPCRTRPRRWDIWRNRPGSLIDYLRDRQTHWTWTWWRWSGHGWFVGFETVTEADRRRLEHWSTQTEGVRDVGCNSFGIVSWACAFIRWVSVGNSLGWWGPTPTVCVSLRLGFGCVDWVLTFLFINKFENMFTSLTYNKHH